MLTDYYTTTFNLYTNSGSLDSNGDYTESTASFASGKCKLMPISRMKARHMTDKGEVWADYRAYMAPISGITEYKNMVVGGNLYQILFIANRIDNHLEVDLRKIS